MKTSEIRALTQDQLNEKLIESKKELLNLRFQVKFGEIENTARITIVKKIVARLLTVANERKNAKETVNA